MIPRASVRIVASARASQVPAGIARTAGVAGVWTAEASASTAVAGWTSGSASATAAAPTETGAGEETDKAGSVSVMTTPLGASAGATDDCGSTKYIAQTTRR